MTETRGVETKAWWCPFCKKPQEGEYHQIDGTNVAHQCARLIIAGSEARVCAGMLLKLISEEWSDEYNWTNHETYRTKRRLEDLAQRMEGMADAK